jgi:AraC family carnitine catabolism transcriptional activator
MNLDFEQPTPRGRVHMVFVVVARFNLTTLITMIETMRVANYLSPDASFSWEIISFDGPRVVASNGVSLTVMTQDDVSRSADYIFVLASWGGEHYQNRNLVAWLRRRARQGETICAVELGCYVVARAGLLDTKEATTHWSWINGFHESFGNIDVKEQVFTINNRVITCAGGLAGIDLMLHLIEKAHGAGLSGEIADQMLLKSIRPETTPQRQTMGHGTAVLPPVIREAISIIERNIEEPLSVPEIAAELNVSQRQLERSFKKQIGCTVVQFGLLLRLQRARLLLISTNLSVREIATASGFNTLSHFAYSFGKFFDRRPSEYREAWPQDETAPTWPGTLSDFISSLHLKQRSQTQNSPRS